MGVSSWAAENWQTLGIIASILFTAFLVREEIKARRISNLLWITESHRKLWTEFYDRPELDRVLDEGADPQQKLTRHEEIFINLIILHLSTVFYAHKLGLVVKVEGLRRDISWFFALPVPRAMWERSKILQNEDFVAFVERCRTAEPQNP